MKTFCTSFVTQFILRGVCMLNPFPFTCQIVYKGKNQQTVEPVCPISVQSSVVFI